MDYLLTGIIGVIIGFMVGMHVRRRSDESLQLLPPPKCKADGCNDLATTTDGYCEDHWWYGAKQLN